MENTVNLLKECDAGTKTAVNSIKEVLDNVESEQLLTLLTDADGFGAEALMTLSGIDFGEDGEGSYIAVYDGSEVEVKAEDTVGEVP